MIELQDVLNIHNILIDKFGASKGDLRFDEIKQWIEMRLRKKNEA